MDEILKSGTFASYETYKEAFDAEVRRTELGFVRIGYMLRVAKDTPPWRNLPGMSTGWTKARPRGL